MKYLSSIFLFILVGCGTVYVPNKHNAPLFEKSNEFNVGASISLTNGITAQTSYSFSKNFAVLGSVQASYWSIHLFDYAIKRYQWFVEGGLGYYKASKTRFCYGVYVLGGRGYSNSKYKTNGISVDYWTNQFGNYYKIVLQPVVGYHIKNIEFGSSFQLGYLNYYDLQTITQGYYSNEPILNSVQNILLVSPAFFIRIGNEQIKGEVQAGFSGLLGLYSKVPFNKASNIFTLGVNYTLK